MKKLFITFSIIVCLVVLGKYAYDFFINVVSDKLIENVINDLLDDQIVDELLSNPEITELVKEFMENQQINPTQENLEQLPFSTKEEGVKVILKNFSIKEMNDISNQFQSSLTIDEQLQLVYQLKDRFSEEELNALMAIGVAELQKELMKRNP
ncbi:hypothetical protein BKP37_16915 [Anaerobacillus alkalilacustris]|uniref:Uncharacterized protein n=1 Tax=Anaerobacillus alkalilacustris TaxID=393763 RepID=A0A1S2LFS1_9BACI|nr:hypothetical protein [Anaerobacillus alkalilacustris]OIJ11090.1 hypothetical protein BKP37_16915 [Anaerobacillus alkalilacustris]